MPKNRPHEKKYRKLMVREMSLQFIALIESNLYFNEKILSLMSYNFGIF